MSLKIKYRNHFVMSCFKKISFVLSLEKAKTLVILYIKFAKDFSEKFSIFSFRNLDAILNCTLFNSKQFNIVAIIFVEIN